MKTHDSIRHWVNNLLKVGRLTFSLEEVRVNFAGMDENTIARSLTRLVSDGIILSVHQGFYVVIPTEYSLKGIVPPIVYINQLMDYLRRKYYVGLLDAAAFYGAARQLR